MVIAVIILGVVAFAVSIVIQRNHYRKVLDRKSQLLVDRLCEQSRLEQELKKVSMEKKMLENLVKMRFEGSTDVKL